MKTTSKAIFVTVPAGSSGFVQSLRLISYKTTDGELDSILLPSPGNYKMLGMLHELTDSQAALVIEEPGSFFGMAYKPLEVLSAYMEQNDINPDTTLIIQKL